jgi:hypothetical protein
MRVLLQVLGVIFLVQIAGLSYYFATSEDLRILCTSETVASSTSTNYPDSERREFFKQVLESMGIEYTEEQRNEETWVVWSPKSDDIEEEIRERVDQYYFVLNVCPELPLPKPGDPPKSDLSCTLRNDL